MEVKAFFHNDTNTLTYVVFDKESRDAVIIDPVLDYEQGASTYSFDSVEKIEKFILGNNLTPHYVMETHVHADHITGSQELKRRFPKLKSVIGSEIYKVKETFQPIYNFSDEYFKQADFDQFIDENNTIIGGTIKISALNTPGHTPSCLSYLIEKMVFTGDALFMPDAGTGRCDFPSGSAEDLYNSVKNKLYALPNNTRVFPCHDYPPAGREIKWESTILEEKQANILLKEDTTLDEFVKTRSERDKTLGAPRLLLPSIQINLVAGKLPIPEHNGMSYLKIPIQFNS